LQVGARFAVNTLVREFTLTVQQIVDQFRLENCPEEIIRLWENGGAAWDIEYVVCHEIGPNTVVNARRAGPSSGTWAVPKTFTYREIYWLKGKKTECPLSKRGFNLKPFMTLRGYVAHNDAYGRSFCMDALGDVKQVQTETQRKGEFIEKGV